MLVKILQAFFSSLPIVFWPQKDLAACFYNVKKNHIDICDSIAVESPAGTI